MEEIKKRLQEEIAALETVKATGQPSSAIGEGLADALNVGSY